MNPLVTVRRVLGVATVASRQSHCVTLILQADGIWWLKSQNKQVVQHQRFDSDQYENKGAAVLPMPEWVSDACPEKPCEVSLVLDTSIDQIDRVKWDAHSTVVVSTYKKWRILRSLRREYTESLVYALSADAGEPAAIMHAVIPDGWRSYLQKLQTQSIVFSRVATSTQLACRWARDFDGYVLLTMPSQTRQQHILVHSGAALLLRNVSLPAQSAIVESALGTDGQLGTRVLETINYIREKTTVNNQPLVVVEPTVLHNQLSVFTKQNTEERPNVAHEHDCMSACTTEHLNGCVALLFDFLHDLPVQYRKVNCSADASLIAPNNVLPTFGKWKTRLPVHTRSGGRALPTLRRIFLAFSGAPNYAYWQLTASKLRWANYLEISYLWLRDQRWRVRLGSLSLVLACIALMSVAALGVSGARNSAEIQRLDSQRAVVNQFVSQLQREVTHSGVSHQSAADSLFIVDELRNSGGLSPDHVLNAIGGVLVTSADVVLDRLAWVTLDSAENIEALNHALSAIVSRQHIQSSDDAGVQLFIEGVIEQETLVAQKKSLDEFVAKLKGHALIDTVTVLESPLDAAMSSAVQGSQSGRYQLTARFGVAR